MKNLELLAGPAALLTIWIVVAAFTLAQLGTIQPMIGAAGLRAAQGREGQRILEARTHFPRRRPVAR